MVNLEHSTGQPFTLQNDIDNSIILKVCFIWVRHGKAASSKPQNHHELLLLLILITQPPPFVSEEATAGTQTQHILPAMHEEVPYVFAVTARVVLCVCVCVCVWKA